MSKLWFPAFAPIKTPPPVALLAEYCAAPLPTATISIPICLAALVPSKALAPIATLPVAVSVDGDDVGLPAYCKASCPIATSCPP